MMSFAQGALECCVCESGLLSMQYGSFELLDSQTRVLLK